MGSQASTPRRPPLAYAAEAEERMRCSSSLPMSEACMQAEPAWQRPGLCSPRHAEPVAAAWRHSSSCSCLSVQAAGALNAPSSRTIQHSTAFEPWSRIERWGSVPPQQFAVWWCCRWSWGRSWCPASGTDTSHNLGTATGSFPCNRKVCRAAQGW